MQQGEIFWLHLTTASAQCLRLSERFFHCSTLYHFNRCCVEFEIYIYLIIYLSNTILAPTVGVLACGKCEDSRVKARAGVALCDIHGGPFPVRIKFSRLFQILQVTLV